jgi:RNA polymerase sigma factor (sigma-70 family)
VKTKKAAEQARQLAERIRSGKALAEKPDEQQLFRNLHACAFQATKRMPSGNAVAAERASWVKRWQVVRDYIVEQNLPLVYTMLGRFDTSDLDRDDALSEAMLALTQAVERFDPWRGFRLSTYACHAIYRAMVRSSKATSDYRRLFPAQFDVSFERPYGPETRDELYVERLQRAMKGNLGNLTEIESTVLSRRFPPDRDLRRETLQQVGQAVGLSKERVRQIQNEALAKLRLVLEADPALQ